MISGFQQIVPSDARKVSTTKNGVVLGTLAVTRDGKFYAWSLAGAANLATSKLTVNADADANVVNKTVARTTAAGALSVIVDAAGTVVADAYVDGTFTASDATGEGHDYLVVGNTGVTGAGEITIFLAEPLVEALTIDVSEYTLVKNLYDSVVISATDQADAPVGVPNQAVTAANYFWNQIRGRSAVWADEAVARGLALTIGTGSAGAVEALDAAGEPQIGVVDTTLVDTEYTSAFLSMNV